MRKFLKYKYYPKIKSHYKLNARLYKFNRPKFKYLKKSIKRSFLFDKWRSGFRLLPNPYEFLYFSAEPQDYRSRLERFLYQTFRHKFWNLKGGLVSKVIDSYPVKSKTGGFRRLQNKYYKGKIRRNLAYRLNFNQTLKRKYYKFRIRWNFMREKYFKHYYDVPFVLSNLFFYRSIYQVKQQTMHKKISVNHEKPKLRTILNFGDHVEVNDDTINIFENQQASIERTFYFSHLEVDYYTQTVIVVKDFTELTREDTILINVPSTRFVNFNYLRV